MISPTIQVFQSEQETDLQGLDRSGLNPLFLQHLVAMKSTELVANVETSCFLVRVGQHGFPCTVNETQYENSYVCSPYNGMIRYPLDELKHLDSFAVRWGVRILAHGLSPFLKLASINRVVTVNNAMLSTNLYPDWTGCELTELTQELTRRFPRHAILFRSLNPLTTPELCETFRASDYFFVPSRLLYVFDPAKQSGRRKRNLRFDFRLLEETQYRVIHPDELTASDDSRIRDLYNQLYLEKYSFHNPQFTDRYIRLFRETEQIRFLGLQAPSGELVGVIGTLEMNDHFTTPIVGYDFDIPKSHGLYRLLTALVIRKSIEENRVFNMSSGVGKFKKHRGAEPCLEFSAIYTHHLPFHQKMAWNVMARIMKNVAAPIVQKYEL